MSTRDRADFLPSCLERLEGIRSALYWRGPALRRCTRRSLLAPLVEATGKDPIRILFCCDPAYFQHLAVALVSLLESNQPHHLEIHIITEKPDLRAEDALLASVETFANFEIQFHNFSWPEKHLWHTSGHITPETYTRIFCPYVLPASMDKVLYLDADLVVVDDLADLWRTNIDDVALAAVADPYACDRVPTLGMAAGSTYVNAGVLLINLGRWRAEDITGRLCSYIAREGPRLRFHDQDALNAVLHLQTRTLDARWNMQARAFHPRGAPAEMREGLRRAASSPAIIHYTTNRKPWIYTTAIPRKRLYQRYLRKTAWRGQPPAGRSTSALAERLFNGVVCALRLDTSWQEIAQTTPAGKAISWLWRRLARDLRGFGSAPGGRSPVLK